MKFETLKFNYDAPRFKVIERGIIIGGHIGEKKDGEKRIGLHILRVHDDGAPEVNGSAGNTTPPGDAYAYKKNPATV